MARFLMTDGAKMAKRVRNESLTVEEIRAESSSLPAALRHFGYLEHSHALPGKELNLFLIEALDAVARNAVRRVGAADRLAAAQAGTPELGIAAATAVADAEAALFDDLNACQMRWRALFTFINRANAELDRRGSDQLALVAARAAFRRLDSVLDIVPDRVVDDPELAAWVEERIAARRAARSRRDFAEADRLRAELVERGIAIEDTPNGTVWKRQQ